LILLIGLYILLNEIVLIKFVNYFIAFQKIKLFSNECIALKMLYILCSNINFKFYKVQIIFLAALLQIINVLNIVVGSSVVW